MPMPSKAVRTASRASALRRAGVAPYGRTRGLSPRSDWSWLTGEPWPTKPLPATEGEALGLPPFGRGLALLANAVAATDWHAQRYDPALGVSVRLPNQPPVVTNPYPLTTAWNYRWAATEDGVLYGNHFAIVGRTDTDTNLPEELIPVPADEVWMLIDPDGGMRWTIGGTTYEPFGWAPAHEDEDGRSSNGLPVPSYLGQLMHVPYGNRSGQILGRGVLAQYADSLGGYVAAERFSGDYFASGTLPPAVLQSPTVVEQDQADELKAKWREMTSTREPVVLPMGYLLTPVVSNAEQSQLVESRTWNAELIAMMLGIPPWKLGLAGPTMTYQNVETADIDFIRDSADRYGRPLAEGFSKWLMPRGTSVVFDYADRMRADQTTTATVLTTYVGAGIMTEDEARAVLNRPPKAAATDANTTPDGVPELTPSDVAQTTP